MTWIQTYSGRKFSLVDPQPEDVDINDIIASLGNLVRFNGHCRGQYTVLQHSIHVAELCPDHLKYIGLLHDAGEAYYGDITRPQKQILRKIGGERFREYLDKIDNVVRIALGIPYRYLPIEVMHCDNIMLATEARDLMAEPPEPWTQLPPPRKERIEIMLPMVAYGMFAEMFHKYKNMQ